MIVDPVIYEICQCTPGMQYVKDGEQNWTPIVRKRKTSKTMHTKESISTSLSDSELDIGTGNQVHLVSSWQRLSFYTNDLLWKRLNLI